MKNVSITAKIMLILGTFGLFTLAVAYYATGQIAHIGASYNSLITGDEAAALDITRASRQFQSARAAINDLMLASTDAQNRLDEAEVKTGEAKMEHLADQAAADSTEDASDFAALKAKALDVINNGCHTAILAGAAATTDVATLASQQLFSTQCSPLFPPVTDAFQAKVIAITAHIAVAVSALRVATNGTIVKTYGGIIGGLIIIAMAGFFGARTWIIKPIRDQLTTMGRLARGDYDAEVGGIERRDEVGEIARAVALFRDAGQQKVRLEEETAKQRAQAEEERSRQEAEQAPCRPAKQPRR